MTDDRLVFRTAHFFAEQSAECVLPGYLVLRMNEPVDGFAALAPAQAADRGRALSLAGRAIEEVVRPERVYVCRFGELLAAVHFHLFPRTAWVLEHYRRAHPGETVSGPVLFEWARTRYGTAALPPDPGLDAAATPARLRDFAARELAAG